MGRAFCLIFLLSVNIAFSEGCPEPFTSLGEHCYFFSDKKSTWTVARETCKNMNITEGADLAVFDKTCDDYLHIFFHINQLEQSHWWLGGTDEEHEDYWVWTDGRTIDMWRSYWHPNEPNESSSQNSLVLWYDLSETFARWRIGDTLSSYNYTFICQLGIH